MSEENFFFGEAAGGIPLFEVDPFIDNVSTLRSAVPNSFSCSLALHLQLTGVLSVILLLFLLVLWFLRCVNRLLGH